MIAFSYYGSKSKIVKYYPPPLHNTIIEPFAGAANYSLAYWRSQVILYDLNPATIQVWRFLQMKDVLYWIKKLPIRIKPKITLEELIPSGAPEEMRRWLEAIINDGSFGSPKQGRSVVTVFSSKLWGERLRVIPLIIRQVKHWTIVEGDYKQAKNRQATWFIDPPYRGEGGKHYVYGSNQIDYIRLAEWCKSRKGQVIVCEMGGADWLPFKELVRAERLGHRKSFTYKEVMWYRENN